MSPVSMPEVPDKFFKPNRNPDNEPDDGAGPSRHGGIVAYSRNGRGGVCSYARNGPARERNVT